MLKTMKYPALAAVLCVTQAACTLDALGAGAKTDSSLPAVSRVVVISIDGLRGDAVRQMPALSALESRAVWTDSMQTVVPSLTVPGHLAMFTGRDVTTMGVTTNTLDQSAGLSLAINGATTMFQWVKDAGGRTRALAATSLIPASSLASAQSFFGIDQITSVDADLNALRANAIAAATAADAPTLLFVHIPTVDFAGHDFGWVRTDVVSPDGADVLGSQYLSAARSADSVVDAIWRALQPAIENGDVALVVTADHGGGHGEHCVAGMPAIREHCTSQPGDRTTPFLLIAKGVAAGRLAGQPTVMQVAPTVGQLLRVKIPARAGAPIQ
jgi:predicted AlkP superfamily pyrophosphatase or phosphodiesterase